MLSRPQGHSETGRIMSLKNSNDTIRNRTRDLPVSVVICAVVSDIPRVFRHSSVGVVNRFCPHVRRIVVRILPETLCISSPNRPCWRWNPHSWYPGVKRPGRDAESPLLIPWYRMSRAVFFTPYMFSWRVQIYLDPYRCAGLKLRPQNCVEEDPSLLIYDARFIGR